MTIDTNPLDNFITKLTRRTPLSPADAKALRALPVTVRTIDAASYLVREGETPDPCSVLVSGFAYRQKLSGDGERQIVAVHVPGDMLDFQNLFLDVADHSVQMLTTGEVGFVSRASVQEVLRSNPALMRAIMTDLMVEASILREWLLNVGQRDARTRLSHLLCEVAARLHANGLADRYGFELPMTQEQLADALGLTSVHINRTLKVLADAGLITRSKRRVGFVDYALLCEAADFNARYLHLGEQAEDPGWG